MEQSNRSVNEFYDGSHALDYFVHVTGLPIDHVNFIACQLIALVVGYWFRVSLSPQHVSPTYRHVVQILIGVPLTYFCFGRQIFHLIAQSAFCLFLMHAIEPGIMEKVVLIVAILYLCVCHAYRVIYDYGGYTLDITGPLMLNTQRLSSLAFSFADGRSKDLDKLKPSLRRYAILRFPSIIESASYIFCFHGLMCGPFCFYKDYIAFIEGTCYSSKQECQLCENDSTTAESSIERKPATSTAGAHCSSKAATMPSPMSVIREKHCLAVQQHKWSTANIAPNHETSEVMMDSLRVVDEQKSKQNNYSIFRFARINLRCDRTYLIAQGAFTQKFFTSCFYGMMTIWVLPKFPASIITGPQFADHSWLHKMFLVMLYAALQRQKYYFAWKLGESVNTMAGLGFNGYDDVGRAKWDLIDNADIVAVELSTSLKQLLDNWNRSTTYWLRHIIYDRTQSTVTVFLFSALWHGFYAGYYVTFCTGGLFIHTARLVRRKLRPYFLGNAAVKFIYDCATFISTRTAIAYLGFPFLVLELQPIISVYWNVYFWMHICATCLFIALTFIRL